MSEIWSARRHRGTAGRPGAALACLALLSGCANQSDMPLPVEYSVNAFTYNLATDKGKVIVEESFSSPVTAKTASAAMVDILLHSATELQTYFPDVPASIRNGQYNCTVTARSHNADKYTFDLACVALPANILA